jgi:5'-3' exoribonuclease 2
MKYYYNGCPSWKWFYPFHYAPFASDLKNIERFQNSCTNFDLGEPFRPIEQLMAVLPEDSSHAIPKASRWLMRDQESPIIDFYPKDIACDPNGKAMPWLWVVLLPFIDEDRLLSALKPTEKDWSDYEKLCNARGLSDGYVYCHVSHSLAASITPVIESRSNAAIEDGPISGQLSLPLSTEVYPLDKKSTIFPPKTSHKIENSHNIDGLLTTPIDANAALCAAFQEPSMKKHLSIILKGAKPPDSILEASDYQIRRPRLNRGGGTIANLGTAREGASHQSGYGSMNISSYERQLAERSGRGHQMNQAGTRAWGAMEPSVKRQRYDNNGGHPNRLYQNPFHQQSNYRGNNNVSGTSQFNSGVYNHNSNPRWQPPPHLRQPGHQQFQPNNSIPIPPPPSSRQGYSFQNFASRQVGRGQQGYSHRLPQPGRGNGSSAPIRSGVSSDVMNNLRNQLSSTLNRSKTNNDQRR